MINKRLTVLICTASFLLIVLVVTFFSCTVPVGDGDASGSLTDGYTDSIGANTDSTDHGSGDSESESEPAATTDAAVTTPFAEVTEDTVTDLPAPVTVTLDQYSVSLSEGETARVAVTLSGGAVPEALSIRFRDNGVASAELKTSGEAHEIEVSAVSHGETSVDVLYNGIVMATFTVEVSVSLDPKPLPPVVQSSEIDPSKPMLALTFDDGPGKYTDKLLDILKKYNAHATFYVQGVMIEKHEAVIKRASAEGHEIGNHTWDHTKLTSLNKDRIREEIVSVQDYIERLTGIRPRTVRPPYGSVNDDVVAIAVEEGFLIARWSVDTEDWKTLNADATYDAIMRSAKDGSIILCHDIHESTVEAMDRTIAGLIEQGYQLVTVSEMLEYSGVEYAAGDIVRKK